jgi:uncharacterized protein
MPRRQDHGTRAAIHAAVPDAIASFLNGRRIAVVRQAARCGVRAVWFHRSFGTGSVSDAAVAECKCLNVTAIVGGCPLMYCEPVDVVHRCMRAVLAWRGGLP